MCTIYVVLVGFSCCVAGHVAFELLLELSIGLSIEALGNRGAKKWLTLMPRNVDLADFVDSCDLLGPLD